MTACLRRIRSICLAAQASIDLVVYTAGSEEYDSAKFLSLQSKKPQDDK